MASKKQQSYLYGHLCEWLTIYILAVKGYRLLERRFKTRAGEIDIIMKRGKRLLFIEVKARSDEFAHEALKARQQARITQAARLYIAKHPEFANLEARFDAMLWRGFKWRHIKHAWQDV